MPLKKQHSSGWLTSSLEIIGKSGEDLILKSAAGVMPTRWKRLDGTASGRNLVAVCKGSKAQWHLKWFADSNGVRRILEILDDEQYEAWKKAAWQTRKLWKHGFQTANKFVS